MTHRDTKLETRLLHTGIAEFNPKTGLAPVTLPAVRTSTVRFQNLQALDNVVAQREAGARPSTYGRPGLETHVALEEVFCELEGAKRSFLAPSGLSAISLVFLALLSKGDHVLVADCVYGPVRYLDKTVLRRMGIEVSYCRGTPEDMQAQLRPETRMVYVESPGSLLLEMLDLPALAAFARDKGLTLVTDNTWGAGYAYRPLALGAHVSVVAGTKYVGGHADLMLGAVAVADEALVQQITDTHYALGYTISAEDAWLALRGVRTLPLRMRHHAHSALEICRFLAAKPEVARIYHPAWQEDPGHALWQRDCLGSNGLMSVELKLNYEQGRRFVDALRLFSIGFSWGGFESLVQWVEPPTLKPHSYWQGKGDTTVVRLHVGLEAVEDLCADLEQALAAALA
ncbi:aminotransferase class I/II-fold pyridoxal phosphate-dependent enzyme [Pusillimonas sp. CC-YST705]|uniref:Aminotransferase class I/II-fold pyridoxal phosphate-dependent enzyme n=1 Tax=Mesopusillimonas faecipullorum TaxID=2755040 RepID=A0ABS8CES6_9BURK|nr:aminotransferase class I/II-fold pyridoxal phosphate-dependent enzyme [Mesopusillimonas faecipullorum]MCB5364309.1 aminotransferase class I/II-fold pyridoxal phosphate-dependent enzyme [Mesopusillimonas faecipullorum]